MKAIIELKPSLRSLSHAGRKGMKWGKKIFDTIDEKTKPLQDRIKEVAAVKEATDRMNDIVTRGAKAVDPSIMAKELLEFQRDYAANKDEMDFYIKQLERMDLEAKGQSSEQLDDEIDALDFKVENANLSKSDVLKRAIDDLKLDLKYNKDAYAGPHSWREKKYQKQSLQRLEEAYKKAQDEVFRTNMDRAKPLNDLSKEINKMQKTVGVGQTRVNLEKFQYSKPAKEQIESLYELRKRNRKILKQR